MNPWLLVAIAGLCEVGWALGLRYSDGFTRLVPTALTLALVLLSFWFLSLALRTLPIGTAYAVWVGIGAVGTAIAGVFLFHEPANALRVIGILLILGGIVVLKMA